MSSQEGKEIQVTPEDAEKAEQYKLEANEYFKSK